MRRFGWLLVILGVLYGVGCVVELVNPATFWLGFAVAIIGAAMVAEAYETDTRRRPGYIIDDPSRRER